MKPAVLCLPVALWLGGCASLPDVSQLFNPETPVAVQEVARSLHCGTQSAAAEVHVLADAGSVGGWQAEHGVRLAVTDTLRAGPYALVEMGLRDTGGYGLVVSRNAGVRSDMLVLKATFIEPATDRPLSYEASSPCVLVSLPAGAYRGVTVVNQLGQVQASTRP